MTDIDHIGQLKPDPANARKHNPRNVGMIEDAMNEVGAARSIVIDEDGVILAGNATIEAAAQAGIERVQVVDADGETIVAVRRSGLTPEQKRRLALYDNRTAELAAWDTEILAEFAALDTAVFDGLFNAEELWELVAGLGDGAPADAEPQIDKAEELREKWGVQSGQLWLLGEHRLVCGDCTDAEVVARVMDGEKAGLSICDPPYNYDFDYGMAEDNLSIEEYEAFTRKWWATARRFCLRMVVTPGLKNLDFYYRNFSITWTCAWVKKNAMTASRIGNLSVWEPILFDADDWDWEPIIVFGKTRKKVKRDVYEYPIRVQEGVGGHPCPKLLEFWEKLITDFSSNEEAVLDVFLGSGTTLIACERLGRKCRAIEIEPKYVAVAIQRWVDVTGGTPELAGG